MPKDGFGQYREAISTLKYSQPHGKGVGRGMNTVEVTNEYAGHFFNMFVNKYEGKHLTGDQVQILLLSLPFLLCDLIKPEK